MLIAHVIDNLRRESGGPVTVVRELAIAQARHGDDVAIIYDSAAEGDASLETVAALRESGVRCIPAGEIGRIRRSKGLEQALGRLDPGVVHLHCVWDPIVMAAAALTATTPTVLSTHGMLHPVALRSGSLRKWAYLRIHRKLLRSIGQVLALNDSEALHIRTNIHAAATTVPNGIDTAALASVAAVRASYANRLASDAPFLLNIGRIHEIKGLDRLIRSFADSCLRGSAADLVIAGPDGGAQRRLDALSRRVAPPGRIRFHGPAWGPVKHELLARCAAFVHTPRFEGFGIAVAEALGAGVPTLTTANCHLDGAAEAGALLQVEDSDIAVARGIERILEDQDLRQSLSNASRSWAASRLSWESVAERTRTAYLRAGAE